MIKKTSSTNHVEETENIKCVFKVPQYRKGDNVSVYLVENLECFKLYVE